MGGINAGRRLDLLFCCTKNLIRKGFDDVSKERHGRDIDGRGQPG